MNSNMLIILLVSNAFLAIGLVALINGIVFRKRMSLPVMSDCLFSGSFLTIAAILIDLAVFIKK